MREMRIVTVELVMVELNIILQYRVNREKTQTETVVQCELEIADCTRLQGASPNPKSHTPPLKSHPVAFLSGGLYISGIVS